MTCPLPGQHKYRIPSSVSLVVQKCNKATNNLIVNNKVPTPEEPKMSIGICVKSLTIVDDISAQLVEWIETVKKLGANKIFFYILDVHPNISKVDYYFDDDIFQHSSGY